MLWNRLVLGLPASDLYATEITFHFVVHVGVVHARLGQLAFVQPVQRPVNEGFKAVLLPVVVVHDVVEDVVLEELGCVCVVVDLIEHHYYHWYLVCGGPISVP